MKRPSTKWPVPTRDSHDQFCKNEGWRRVRDARGRTGTHHVTYELYLPDGRILRTRISHPPDRTTYGPSMWRHILNDQLQVSEEEFWACAREGIMPDRGGPVVPAESLPADLVYLLVTRVGMTETAVARLTRDEAVARIQRFWAEGS